MRFDDRFQASRFAPVGRAAFAMAVWLVPALCAAQGYAPSEAIGHMTTAEGLQVTLFASEPEVRQPIFVKCDDRGRLWTIQYLQYPNPAGLKRVKVDRWSRTTYDRVPKPPPYGPRGADRITILEDTDGDGAADRYKDFVNGLNLVTGLAFGHGGVYVLNVPYLLFYPDHDRDDVPDSDPKVLLKGFGMEDAQSMSNHLTWGPDGWLYGVNGSTTTCKIRGNEFQQGVWRYHPGTDRFELFCEGGSNCYGLTFDAHGELFYSTNAGPFVHAVQGGYFYKSFGKHGPLHNLYAYHYFPQLERDQVPGGPPTGGTVYLEPQLPRRYHGAFLAGNFLGHTVSSWTVEPVGSTFRARYQDVLLDTHDTWSGPTDLCVGPAGELYVCDFYDKRTAHPDPDAQWDTSNGRIYRIARAGSRPAPPFDLTKRNSAQLLELMLGDRRWWADRARAELMRRRDASVVPQLDAWTRDTADAAKVLAGLWALAGLERLDEGTLRQAIDHADPYVRYWAARLAGDGRATSAPVAEKLARRAAVESSPVVRAQLAATARRLAPEPGMRIVLALLEARPEDPDPRVPWLLWWAIESHIRRDAAMVVDRLARPAFWHNDVGRRGLLLTIRRLAAEGTRDSYQQCLRVIDSAPADALASVREHLRQGLSERAVGLAGLGQGGLFEQAARQQGTPRREVRKYEPVTEQLARRVRQWWTAQPLNPVCLELALRSGIPEAYPALRAALRSTDVADNRRVALLKLLGEFGREDAVAEILEMIAPDQPVDVQGAAVDFVGRFADPRIAEQLLARFAALKPEVQSRIRDALVGRAQWALLLLDRVEGGEIPPESVPLAQLRKLAFHHNEAIDERVRRIWGNIGPGTPEEKLATMRRYNNDLRAAPGDPARGKVLFAKNCGICHRLYGEGNRIGPDLTTANRADRAALLANIVDPSAVVRREYISYVASTVSGKVIRGLLAEEDAASFTFLDAENKRIRVPRDEIEAIQESSVSLMPERLLEPLTPQQRRDLFAYLQSSAPPK